MNDAGRDETGTNPMVAFDSADIADADVLDNVAYPSGFYHHLNPHHLNLVCSLNGIEGPSLDGRFTYCEIGCGSGQTPNILAAANPNGRFYGIDFSAQRIGEAKAMAAAADVENIEFLLADISDMDTSNLPMFDYIALHGVYSWVPQHVQRAIIDFIDTRLSPGGLVMLSYNTLPGWGGATAIRKYFIGAAERLDGSPEEKTSQILAFLKEYREKEAPFFMENAATADLFDRLMDADVGYVAHEFFAASWQPLVFAEVNTEMERIGLEFAGDGLLYSNFTEFSAPPEFHELLDRIPDRIQRESEKDFICNRSFRGDVYIRPADKSRPENEFDALKGMLFGFNVTPVEVKTEIAVYKGKINLGGPWLDRLNALLHTKVLTFAEILADDFFRDLSAKELRRGFSVLCNQIQLCAFRSREQPITLSIDTFQIVPKINRHLMSASDGGKDGLFLASPVSGSGVFLRPIEVVFLRGLSMNTAVEGVWDELQTMGLEPTFEGRTLAGSPEDLEIISRVMESFRTGKLPKLAQLGIVDPVVAEAGQASS